MKRKPRQRERVVEAHFMIILEFLSSRVEVKIEFKF